MASARDLDQYKFTALVRVANETLRRNHGTKPAIASVRHHHRAFFPRRSCGAHPCSRGEARTPKDQPVSTSFRMRPGDLIERWNSRIRGTTSLRKREPLNTP